MRIIIYSALAAVAVPSAVAAILHEPGVRLGAHVFQVPDAHLATGSVFFLPEPDPAEGFSFWLNPSAPLQDRLLVSVSPKALICANAAGTEAFVNGTICAPEPHPWRGKPRTRVGGEPMWRYTIQSAVGGEQTQLVFATCNGAISGRSFCTADIGYSNDLVLSVRFRNQDIDQLEALYDRSVALLREWER